MAASAKTKQNHWSLLQQVVQPLGVDAFLEGVDYTTQTRLLSGFAAGVRTGDF
jgi:hypothetical protein